MQHTHVTAQNYRPVKIYRLCRIALTSVIALRHYVRHRGSPGVAIGLQLGPLSTHVARCSASASHAPSQIGTNRNVHRNDRAADRALAASPQSTFALITGAEAGWPPLGDLGLCARHGYRGHRGRTTLRGVQVCAERAPGTGVHTGLGQWTRKRGRVTGIYAR